MALAAKMVLLKKTSQNILSGILSRKPYKSGFGIANNAKVLLPLKNDTFPVRQLRETELSSGFSFIAQSRNYENLTNLMFTSKATPTSMPPWKYTGNVLNSKADSQFFGSRSLSCQKIFSSKIIVRRFKTDSEQSKDSPGKDQDDDMPSWVIKLSNENGYLSWCRNTYILTIAAATLYTQEVFVPLAKEAGLILVVVGGVNLIFGTVSYLNNIVMLAKRNMLSKLGVIPAFALATFHLLMWFTAMALFFGYIEELEYEEMHNEDSDVDAHKTSGNDKPYR